MVDIVSLYPSSYLDNYFPAGRILYGYNYEMADLENKIGFFWCRFSQHKVRKGINVLPKRKYEDHEFEMHKRVEEVCTCPPSKGLDWNCKHE
jgi:hypothetical protein